MDGLGVDIGGVIMQRGDTGGDTSFFSDNYLTTPPLDNVFECLRELNEKKFKRGIWLVSKCGEKIQKRTEEWLNYHDFYSKTGIQPDHVLFTRTRQEKLGTAQNLGLSHFIDDRLEVLGYMTGKVPNLYLFNPEEGEVKENREFLNQVIRVSNWDEMLKTIN